MSAGPGGPGDAGRRPPPAAGPGRGTQGQGARSGAGRRRDGATMVPDAEPRSYYGQPIINRPVWTWEVPWYLWAGGLAGASLPLGVAASLGGNRALARRASAVALAGALASPALLVSDLGRPERFLNMLRVFKPTSAMNVGSWILTAFGSAAALGAGRELFGVFPRAGRAGQLAGLVLGPALSTYTATLISGTAVPAWHEARHDLPYVFAASSAASAGGVACALTPPRAAGPARVLAIGGAVSGLAGLELMERRLGPLAAPYHSGTPHRLGQAARALTALGALGLARGGRRRPVAVAAGLALAAGAAAERWSIFAAGMASADDPAATVGPQRERLRRQGGAPTRYVRG